MKTIKVPRSNYDQRNRVSLSVLSRVLLLVRSGSGKSAFELTNVRIWRSARAEGKLVIGSIVSGRVFKPAGAADDGEVQDRLSEIGWNDCAFHREEEHVAVVCRDCV